mgnify:CR=1 FL=1
MNNQQKASLARRLGTVGNLKVLQDKQEEQLKKFQNSKTIEDFEILKSIEGKIKTNLKTNYQDPEKQELYKKEFEKSGNPMYYIPKNFNKQSASKMIEKDLEPKEFDLLFDAFGTKQGEMQELEIDPLLKNIEEEEATKLIELIKTHAPNTEFEKKLEEGDSSKYYELLATSDRLATDLLSKSGFRGNNLQMKKNKEIFSKYFLEQEYFKLDEGVRNTIEKSSDDLTKQSNIEKAEIKEREDNKKEIDESIEKQDQLRIKASEESKILTTAKGGSIDALISQLENNHPEKFNQLSSKSNNQIQENYGDVISSLDEGVVDKLFLLYMNHFIAEDGIVLGVDNDLGHNLRGKSKPIIEPVEEIFNIDDPNPLQPDSSQTTTPDIVQKGLIEADIETADGKRYVQNESRYRN